MRFLADENINFEIINYLEASGHYVFNVKAENLIGATDRFLLELSHEQKLIILTQDSDFGNLIYNSNMKFYGLIFLRQGHLQFNFHLISIQTLLSSDLEFKSPFVIVCHHLPDSVKIRYRQF
jgi:predicted nuclease of predicted toxin-antitoxin system